MAEDKKSGRGGYRPGSGRKKATDEMKARDLAIKAINTKYGSMEQGLVKLLESGEPSLVKFVWEHAQGKPTDKIDMTSRVEETRIVDINDDGTEDEDSDFDDTDETPYDEPDDEDDQD